MTRGVGGIGAVSLLADIGHEVPSVGVPGAAHTPPPPPPGMPDADTPPAVSPGPPTRPGPRPGSENTRSTPTGGTPRSARRPLPPGLPPPWPTPPGTAARRVITPPGPIPASRSVTPLKRHRADRPTTAVKHEAEPERQACPGQDTDTSSSLSWTGRTSERKPRSVDATGAGERAADVHVSHLPNCVSRRPGRRHHDTR